MLKSYVADRGGITREEARFWRNEQRERAAASRFVLSVSQRGFTASCSG
jgi:hypothetical protein